MFAGLDEETENKAAVIMSRITFPYLLLVSLNSLQSGKQPSINAEDDSTVAYADRQLTFAQNVQSIQVNVNTAVGFFILFLQ